jgi:transcriptional regulator with PAS, ATPase and Fis domain
MPPSVTAPPVGAIDGKSWLTATIEARQRALESAAPEARAMAAVRLARAYGFAGDDGGASRLLGVERRYHRKRGVELDVARCELGLAEVALVADDEDRAAVHLEQAGASELPARQIVAAWIAARRGAQRPLPEAPSVDAPWFVELADALSIELLWAREDAGVELRGADVRTRMLADLVQAARAKDTTTVHRSLRALEKAGLARDLGRSILRLLGGAPDLLAATGPTSGWVARAQQLLADRATWRDRVAIRHAWRAHGRRDVDKALPRDVVARLDARDRVRAHVQSTLAIGLDREARAIDELEAVLLPRTLDERARAAVANLHDAIELLDTATGVAVEELGRAEGDLAQLVASTFAERERARAIAARLARLEAATDVEALVDQLSAVVADETGAGIVVIAERVPHVGLRALAARGIAAVDEHWIDAAEGALDTPIGSKPRGTEEHRKAGGSVPPQGPVIVVPMRAAGTDGAIYVEKTSVGATFSAADLATLELLASYGGLALARLRATASSASLGRRLAATIDAMRDGLLAIDAEGVVTAVNQPAARALRVDVERLMGRKIESFAELAPLAAALASPERADSVVVRLAHGSVVLTARGVEGDGVVATLVEYERAQRMAQKLVGPRSRYTFSDLRGEDPALKEALDVARRAASVDASVLIVGESGTGKELLAQAIHAGGPRAKDPFVAINCAALPRELLEAELFGYERGAFTGARAEGSVGKFELAGDGTILLDEIVDMPLDMQVKLLRVLQERVVVRLGSNVERPVRARVLATAQRDLAIDVERGRFRLDLLHRLRVLMIQLPPLRQRPGDVAILARHYVRSFAERQGKAVRDFSEEVEAALCSYAWPGNVRELANVIEGEVSLLSPDVAVLTRVPAAVARSSRTSEPPAASMRDSGAWSLRESSYNVGGPESVRGLQIPMTPILPLAEVERRAYLDAYEKCGRSVTRAAKALGVSKVTFYGKLRQFGMHPAEVTGEIPAARSTSRMLAAEAVTEIIERTSEPGLAIPDDRSPETPPTGGPRSRRG